MRGGPLAEDPRRVGVSHCAHGIRLVWRTQPAVTGAVPDVPGWAAAGTVAWNAHVQALGTATVTDTTADGNPVRAPLAEPTTLVSNPATVVVPSITEKDAVAGCDPEQVTWYRSDQTPDGWKASVAPAP